MPRHGVNVRYVREVLRTGKASKLTKLSPAFIARIKSGKTQTISHGTFNKFRAAFERERYAAVRKHNVSPKQARKIRGKALSLDEAEFAAAMTDFGRTFEHAVNDTVNWREDVKQGRIRDEKEIYDAIDDMAESYEKLAETIVINNGLDKEWVRNGKKFIYQERRIRSRKDAIAHMQEIMALGFRDLSQWDEYVVERQEREQWRPVRYVKDKRSKKTVREFVPEGDPKYNEWLRRLSSGRIITV